MKKFKSVFLAVSFLILASVTVASAGIENLQGYQRINAIKRSYLVAIEDAQADHFAEYERYFQGPDVVDGKPDGIHNVGTNTTKRLSDQETSWRDFDPVVFAAGTALPVNIKMHTQNSEAAWGYTVIFEFWPETDLGEDEMGNTGNHWIFKKFVGDGIPEYGIFDEWYVIDDNIDA